MIVLVIMLSVIILFLVVIGLVILCDRHKTPPSVDTCEECEEKK